MLKYYEVLDRNLPGAFTVQDAMHATGLKRAQIYRILKVLLNKKFVVRPGANKYCCIAGDYNG